MNDMFVSACLLVTHTTSVTETSFSDVGWCQLVWKVPIPRGKSLTAARCTA
jgi:hypothetical protein